MDHAETCGVLPAGGLAGNHMFICFHQASFSRRVVRKEYRLFDEGGFERD
jgi:hypothetical protein